VPAARRAEHIGMSAGHSSDPFVPAPAPHRDFSREWLPTR
jgi:hypothetical protein